MSLIDDFREVNAVAPWFFTLLAGVLGAMVGSFINVCAYRMPKGVSVVSPGSHCACGAPIPWWRNIPVFAWLIWGRSAPCCGRGYSPRYAVVEAACAVLFVGCRLGLPGPVAPVGMVFCALLLTLALIDLDTMYLPDSLNIGLAGAGLALSAVVPALHGRDHVSTALGAGVLSVGDALVGMAVGTTLVYWFRLVAGRIMNREALGEGDVILVGAIGAFLGWQGAIFSFFAGACYGVLYVVPKTLFSRKPTEDERLRAGSLASFEGDEADELIAAGADMGLPFGPWIALGAVTHLLFFHEAVGLWFMRLSEAVQSIR